MPRPARKTRQHPDIAVDAFVLAGGSKASLPGNWFLGQVLWVGGGDVLLNRTTLNGSSYRQLLSVSDVRAAGTIAQLSDLQHEACTTFRALNREIEDAEAALGRARDAVWAKLDVMVAAGMKVLPPAFEEAERERVATQQLIDLDDAEHTAGRGLLLPA